MNVTFNNDGANIEKQINANTYIEKQINANTYNSEKENALQEIIEELKKAKDSQRISESQRDEIQKILQEVPNSTTSWEKKAQFLSSILDAADHLVSIVPALRPTITTIKKLLLPS